MLEKLLDGIVTGETYTVRVIDEGVHHVVDRFARKYTDNGTGRQKLACKLSMATYAVSGLFLLAEAVDHSSFGSKYTNQIDHDLHFFSACAKLIMTKIFVCYDVMSIKERTPKKQANGEIAQDGIYSYQSLTGIARPYVLAFSLLSIVHGIKEGDFTFFKYGLSVLPYALSLYVRDDQSGGLLQRIKQGFDSAVNAFRQSGDTAPA